MSRRKRRRVLRGRQLAAVIAPAPIVFLLRDDFLTADPAPIATPRTAEPGPGTLTITGATQAIIDGKLELTNSGGGWGNEAALAEVETRAAGLALFTKLNFSTRNFSAPLIWNQGTVFGGSAQANVDAGFGMGGADDLDVIANAVGSMAVTGLSTSTDYDLAVVLRDTGAWFFIKGGTFTVWTLLFVADVGTDTTVFPGYKNNSTIGTLDTLRATQLLAPFNSDFGWVTDRLAGARSAGDTFTHTGNCFNEFTVTTVPSAAQIELWFRIQDASNRWVVSIDSSGDLDLDEVVAGVPTQRGTAAGVVVDGERVAIRATDTDIMVYDSAVRRINYAAASNFQTETEGELDTEGTGGAVDDIITWPGTTYGFDKHLAGV